MDYPRSFSTSSSYLPSTSSKATTSFCLRWYRLALSVLVAVANMASTSAQSLRSENRTFMPIDFPYGLAQAHSSGLTELARLANAKDLNSTALPPQEAFRASLRWIDPQDPGQPISNQISLLTCDNSAYADDVDPLDVIANFIDANVSAIVLYSTSSDYCAYTADTDPRSPSSLFDSIYTVTSSRNSTSVENYIRNSGGLVEDVSILPTNDSELDFDEVSSSGNGTPSTAVAMTVLYSITAVITALFIAIIITGVIRAHRHPERYGPRNGQGQERRSRAKGIARAVLDTLPIVKFGGDRNALKPGDVEMVDEQQGSNQQRQREAEAELGDVVEEGREQQEHEPRHNAASAFGSGSSTAIVNQSSGRPKSLTDAISSQPKLRGDGEDTGIAGDNEENDANVGMREAKPAGEQVTEQQNDSKSAEDMAPSCSICTEDFTMGEDIRVLPCDHKFHPACVDPWLLNVSGTCPLCRIDLRPTSQASTAAATLTIPFPTGSAAEDPNAALSPPLHHNQQAEEPSQRLSGLRTVFNLNSNRRRLQNAPTAERIAALQRMRSDNEQQQGRQQRQRWRMSERTTANDDEEDDNHIANAQRGLAGFSGDGIDGFAESNNTVNNNNNSLTANEDPSRRRNRMSVRLQEVFGVRTRRPESVVFAGSAAMGEGEGGGAAAATAAAPARATSAIEPASAREASIRPTVMIVDASNDDDSYNGQQRQSTSISTRDINPSDPPRLPPLNF